MELATADALVGVRDSKDPVGPVLAFTPEEWSAFLAGVKADEFDCSPATQIVHDGSATATAEPPTPWRPGGVVPPAPGGTA